MKRIYEPKPSSTPVIDKEKEENRTVLYALFRTRKPSFYLFPHEINAGKAISTVMFRTVEDGYLMEHTVIEDAYLVKDRQGLFPKELIGGDENQMIHIIEQIRSGKCNRPELLEIWQQVLS